MSFLLFADLVLLAFSEQGLQHALDRNKEIDTRLVKQTQFCANFIALWGFETPHSCQYLNRSLFGPHFI